MQILGYRGGGIGMFTGVCNDISCDDYKDEMVRFSNRHHTIDIVVYISIRDWSLITGKGGYKMGKSQVRNSLRPPLRTG